MMELVLASFLSADVIERVSRSRDTRALKATYSRRQQKLVFSQVLVYNFDRDAVDILTQNSFSVQDCSYHCLRTSQ